MLGSEKCIRPAPRVLWLQVSPDPAGEQAHFRPSPQPPAAGRPSAQLQRGPQGTSFSHALRPPARDSKPGPTPIKRAPSGMRKHQDTRHTYSHQNITVLLPGPPPPALASSSAPNPSPGLPASSLSARPPLPPSPDLPETQIRHVRSSSKSSKDSSAWQRSPTGSHEPASAWA